MTRRLSPGPMVRERRREIASTSIQTMDRSRSDRISGCSFRRALSIAATAVLVAACAASPVPGDRSDTVVLLHGLGRTDLSMLRMKMALQGRGYRVVNLDYPSTQHSIEVLAEETLAPEVAECCADAEGKVHFVTHSMGGIVLRHYLAEHQLPNLGRVVMLSPPNRGSEIADWVAENPMLEALMGPAVEELGTEAGSVPNQLGPVEFELGVIAGNRTLNPIFSRMIPGEDDGKVAVDRTQVRGMSDFLVVPHSHTYIMMSDEVISQVAHFLERGRFARDTTGAMDSMPQEPGSVVELPEIAIEGRSALDSALAGRHSVREFASDSLSLADVGRLLWSVQGVTGPGGRRVAPSAGALYPLEVHLVADRVAGLDQGIYRYRPRTHDLVLEVAGEFHVPLADAALGQDWIADAPAVVVIAAVVERTASKYGQRAERYVHMEVGAAAQSLYLEATALSLGTTFVGAFNEGRVRDVLQLPARERPYAILPVGRPR